MSNNAKVIKNVGTGTVTIQSIAQTGKKWGRDNLAIPAGETVDLSTLYPKKETKNSVNLTKAIEFGMVKVVETYDEVKKVSAPVEKPEAPVEKPEAPVEKPEAPVEKPEAPVEKPAPKRAAKTK